MVFFRWGTLAVALQYFPSCTAHQHETRFSGTTWDDSNWRITTSQFNAGHYQGRVSLANGYLGINVAAIGPFFEIDTPADIDGYPLNERRQAFATIAGFYDYEDSDSYISGIPHWSGLHVEAEGEILDAMTSSDAISNFTSTLDIRSGTMQWSYTWNPNHSPAIHVNYSMFVHKLHVNRAAVQLKITSAHDTVVSVVDALNGDCAVRTDFSKKRYHENEPVIWTAVRPTAINNVTAYVYSKLITDDHCHTCDRNRYTFNSFIGHNESSIAQCKRLRLQAGKTRTITKYVGAASSDAFPDPQHTARHECEAGARHGYENMLSSHAAEWQSIMSQDSIDTFHNPSTGRLPSDPHIIEQQILAVTNPFHLLQNTVGVNAIKQANNNPHLDGYSIPVRGLGSAAYAGQIYWDADAWMAPGIVVSHPQASKQISQLRVRQFPQARLNINAAAHSRYQNQTGKFSSSGAVYPFTTGRYGNCTDIGPCFDAEYHINGDIGLQIFNYYVTTGDDAYFRNELFPVYDAIAQMWSDLVTFNETNGKYELYHAIDPDEYSQNKKNIAFTLALIKKHLENANLLRSRLGLLPVNDRWTKIASLIDLPTNEDAQIILEFATMNNSVSVKQADVVLIDDFLDYPNPYTKNDLEYYAGKQSPDGPGMTYGVFSVVANAISTSGCASYTYDLYGSYPYIRAPWFQFSEQLIDDANINGGTYPAYPFLTGIGSANRVAVYGYLGLHLLLDSLNINPSLPPQIQHLRYRTIYWQGWPINAVSNQTHTVLTRNSSYSALPNANERYATAGIPITIGLNGQDKVSYYLSLNSKVTVPNRQPGNVATIEGNIAQCQPFLSENSTSAFVPGQFPLSVVDGSRTTKWQPASANVWSTLTIALPDSCVLIKALHFDWADSPPTEFSVTFSNSSSSSGIEVATSKSIAISSPRSSSATVRPYESNTTDVLFPTPIWSGKYATLHIFGNQGSAPRGSLGSGATVAEFAIIQA